VSTMVREIRVPSSSSSSSDEIESAICYKSIAIVDVVCKATYQR
jgi:hypothetical protein